MSMTNYQLQQQVGHTNSRYESKAHKQYEYTLSILARNNLQKLVDENKQPTRMTYWRRKDQHEFDGTRTHVQEQLVDGKLGVAHLLNVIALEFDITEWPLNDKPPNELITTVMRPTLTYTDPITNEYLLEPIESVRKLIKIPQIDKEYLKEIQNDTTPWNDLSDSEQYARQRLLLQQRKQFSLSLTTFSRQYYGMFCDLRDLEPSAPATQNTTVKVSTSLEAIARGYFELPDQALSVFQSTKNMKLSHHDRATPRNRKRYGNFEGTPWTFNKDAPTWNPRLSNPSRYTQDDVLFAATHGMKDLAELACSMNPTITMPKE